MSDSLSEFAAKTEAMFARVQQQQTEIIRTWVLTLSRQLLADTPGPGNQEPPDSAYYATGRLRAGWSLSATAPPSEASRWDGGPYDESIDGEETVNQIAAELFSAQLPPVFYLSNDVAYGYLVHEGLGRHHRPRPIVLWAKVRSSSYLRAAQQSVMSRAA